MKKFIAVLISVCVMFAVLISCGEQTDSGTNNDVQDNNITGDIGSQDESSEAAEDDAMFDPNLPEADFSGYEFRILNIDQDSMWWAIVDFDEEEEAGEPVPDAMYRRSRNMEDKYNFQVKETQVSAAQVQSIIRLGAAAGSDDYDIGFPHITHFPALAAAGALIDLVNLPNIDLDKAWWNPHMRDYLTLDKKLFATTSDLVLTDNDNIVMLMYNTNIAQTLGLAGSSDIYGMVDEGTWTFDKFAELSKAAASDLNGNGVVDGDEDRFGITLCGWYYQQMMVGFGEMTTRKDENDLPVISIGTERYMRAFQTMVEFMFQRDVVVREFTDSSANTEYVFIEDRALFCAQVLSCVRLYREMESDFAMIPLPKLDENQDRYYTPVLGVTAVVVPITNPDLDRTGHILEALAAESRKLVRPAYFETAIGMQYLRDEDSVRMLDLMLNTQVWDIANQIYSWGGFGSGFDSHASSGNTNVASLIERFEDRIITAMERTVESFSN